MPKQLQTLLTGFGPFGNVLSNPTERLVDYFAQENVPGHDLTVCTVPVSFARAAQIMRAQLEVGNAHGQTFDIVLMLGVATGSPGWRVERLGRNQNEAIPDADGLLPASPVILPTEPESLPVHFPVETLVARLQSAGLPAFASDSAGGYLCNYLLFTTLQLLKDYPARGGFLHVPADECTYAPENARQPLFSFDRQVMAVRIVLQTLAEPIG